MTDDLRTPAPADVRDRLDVPRILFRLFELIEEQNLGLLFDEDLEADLIVLHVGEFDAEGCTEVRLVYKESGVPTGIGAEAHWSALVA